MIRWVSPRPLKEVHQSEDNVVQVMPGPTDRQLLFVGKAMGTSDVVVFDREGDLITHLDIAVGVERGKTRVYGTPGNVHAFSAYSCNPAGCVKVSDEK